VRDGSSTSSTEVTVRARNSRSWLTTTRPADRPEHEPLEPLEAGEVEVVGRLVEQEDVVARQQHRGERGPRRLPARQVHRLGVEQVGRQPEVDADLLGAHVEVGAAEVEPALECLAVVGSVRALGQRDGRGVEVGLRLATPVRRARNADSTSPGLRSGSCGSSPTVAVRGDRETEPESGTSCPARALSSVDLPTPFGPTTPTRDRARPSARRRTGRARGLARR
jgi:hypothetical protein